MNPKAPVKMNAARHPQRRVSQTTSGGAITAPTVGPALKTPVASARSLFGNHSATALMAAGKFPDFTCTQKEARRAEGKRPARQRVSHGGNGPPSDGERVSQPRP